MTYAPATKCPACAHTIPIRRWRYAVLSWDLRRERLECICGQKIEQCRSSTVPVGALYGPLQARRR